MKDLHHFIGLSQVEPLPPNEGHGDHVKDFVDPTSNLMLHSGIEEDAIEEEEPLDVLAEALPTQLTGSKMKSRFPAELKIIHAARHVVDLTVNENTSSAFREIDLRQQPHEHQYQHEHEYEQRQRQRSEASGCPPVIEILESTMGTEDHVINLLQLPESDETLEGRRGKSRASKPKMPMIDGTSDSDVDVPMIVKNKKRKQRNVHPNKETCAKSEQTKQKSVTKKRAATDGLEGYSQKNNTKVRKTNSIKSEQDRRPPSQKRIMDQQSNGGRFSEDEESVLFPFCRSGPIGRAVREATTPESKHKIVYWACQARIKDGLIRGAIEFCHQVLIQWHKESMDIFENIQGCAGTDQALTHRLIGLRNDIAGIWCTYTGVLLDVAYFLRDTRRSRSNRTIDDKKLLLLLDDTDLREKIILALLCEAVAVLGNVQECPLVGNHYLISIGLSLLVDLEVSSTSSGDDLEQGCAGNTLATGVTISSMISLDFESIRELPSAFEKKVTHKYLFMDPEASSLVDGELEKIKGRNACASGKSSRRITPTESAKFVSTRLSRLPSLPANLTLQIDFSTSMMNQKRDDENYREETPTLVPTDSEERELRPFGLNMNSIPIREDSLMVRNERMDMDARTETGAVKWTVEEKVKVHLSAESSTLSTKTYPCYTDNVQLDREEGPGSNVYDVECFDDITNSWKKSENSYPFPSFLHVGNLEVDDNSMALDRRSVLVGDVEQICTGCCIRSFASHRELHAHTRDCLKPLHRKGRNIAFGRSLLPRTWHLNSFDAEDGRDRTLSVLIDVLDYSVELFEVKENDPFCRDIDEVQLETKFQMHRPSFFGQVGLRCRYCLDRKGLAREGSFLFPDSRCNLSQAMWLLCMLHIDCCPNQPRAIKSRHQEYRERLALDSGMVSDYWDEAADDFGLVAKRGRSGVVWRTSSK